jgi:hypothetical protein
VNRCKPAWRNKETGKYLLINQKVGPFHKDRAQQTEDLQKATLCMGSSLPYAAQGEYSPVLVRAVIEIVK